MNLPGRALNASVGLSYHASGVKIAETPGPVGSNWGLIAGGLITRTMYSRPDEMSEGYLKWKELAGDSWSFKKDTMENFAKGLWDSQPDVFHYMFQGYSGKFVFGLGRDGYDTIYTIPTNLMKIDWNDTDTIIKEFKITAEDGTSYYFGKNLTGNREAIETAKSDPFYSGGVSYDYNSAWYLLQVISPTIKDTIDYYYSTHGEFIDYKYAEAHYNPIWTFPEDTSIDSTSKEYRELISYTVPILDSISSAAGYIQFYHSGNRLDGSSKKIDSLTLYNYLGDKIKSFQFGYTHFGFGNDSLYRRLALNQLTEVGSDGTELPSYSFTYHCEDSLPSRDSYKQDYWGYYNNNNQSFLYTAYWGLEGSFRATDTTRVQYGLLKKIEVPSGGYKEFQYESNYISKKRNYLISSSNDTIHEWCSASWDSIQVTTPDTVLFYLPFNQAVYVQYTMDGNGQDPHFMGRLRINDENGTQIWSKYLRTQPDSSGTDIVNLSTGEYSLVLMSYSPDQSASIKVLYQRYRDFAQSYSSIEPYVGGSRIKQVIIHDDISSSHNIITTYTYTDTINSSTSSGVLTDFLPNHHYEYRYDHADSITVYFVRYTRLNSLLFDGGYHLGYGSYQIKKGDSNGITLVSTISPSDEVNESTEEFPYSYPISGDWKRGQVSKSLTYDSDESLRNENYNTYAIYDEEGDTNRHIIKGLKVSLNSNSGGYEKDDLKFESSWSHPVYRKSISYPINGGSPINQEQEFYFDNPAHMKLTRKEVKESDGDSITTRILYPLDYTNGSNNSKAEAITYLRDTFNIQGIPIETYSYQGNDLLDATCNTYKVVNGKVYADTVFVYDLEMPIDKSSFDSSYVDVPGNFLMDDSYRALHAVDKIDSYNRIEESHPVHGNHAVTLFGYNGLYPIATFTNASFEEIAYSSFECQQKGYFAYNEANVTGDTCAVTGNRVLSNGSISKSELPAGKYLLTFWANDVPSIDITNGSYELIDNNSTNRQGWTFFQYRIMASGLSTVSIGSISKIDEVRLFPLGATVTTKTYIPLVGVTSRAGANSIPSYTTYDAFGRPEKIKDQDKYIIQQYQYNYANQ